MTKPNISLLDIAKTIGILCLVFFLITKVPSMFNKYIDSESVDQTTIEQIAKKNVSRAVVVANNKEVNDTIKGLRAQKSVALKSIEDLGDKVSGIGVIVGSMSQNVEHVVPGDYIEADPGYQDLHTFLVHSSLENTDGNKMPIATIYYSPEVEDKDDRIATDAHKIEFKTNVIEAISADGKSTRTVEAWAENNWSLESKGSKYPIDLYIDKWVIKKPPKSFMWNPNLALSVFAGMDGFFPGFSMSFWSYGYTKKDADWRFASVFVGATDEDFMLGVIPVLYNIGNELPLVSNVYIGPFVGSNFEEVIYGAGIVVPF